MPFKKSVSEIEVMQEAINTCKKIGVDNTLAALKLARKDSTEPLEELKHYIIKQVCLYYKVSQKYIFSCDHKSQVKTNALIMLCYFMKVHMAMTHQDASVILHLNGNRQNVDYYLKKYKSLNSKFQNDAALKKDIERVDSLIKEFITTQNSNNG